MKLLIDMNLSPQWRILLGEAGYEADHWSNIGAKNALDIEIMAFARIKDYVVLTHDLDFGAILASTRGEKPSVVQIRADDVSPEAIGAVVVRALAMASNDLNAGALLTADSARMRLRLLPLPP